MRNTINLKETYGHKFRIDFERDTAGRPLGRSPEYQQLQSRIGYVYVHSATHLGFATDKNRSSLNDVPELQLIQDGTDGQNYIFKIEDLDMLADVLKLYRRRQLSDIEKKRLRDIGEDGRFGKDAA